jgi:hypothetical protein
MHFLVFKKNLPLKRYKIALTTGTFWKKNWWKTRYFLFDLTQILISKKFEKKIVFKSSVLAWTGTGSGSGLSKNARSRSVSNQSGSTTLVPGMYY